MSKAMIAIAVCLCLLLAGCAGRAPEGQAGTGGEAAPGQDGISREEQQQLPPLAPAQVRLERAKGQVVLVWTGTGNESGRYEVYRRTAGGPWQLAATLPATGSDTGEYRWTDPAPAQDTEYGVAAVSAYGMHSTIALP